VFLTIYIYTINLFLLDNLYISRSRVRLAVVERLCLGGHMAGETRNALGLSVGKSLGMRKETEGRN